MSGRTQPRATVGPEPKSAYPAACEFQRGSGARVRCLIKEERSRDHARRELFGLSRGLLRQITLNNLSIGHSVDKALCLVQAFQFTLSGFSSIYGGGGTDMPRC
jgi:hypothetical protein